MSRIPRAQEHLKTGFSAEAASAARCRAYAARAGRDGLPNLAEHWRQLAALKDDLAITQLEAAGKVRGGAADVGATISEERYENDVLYPKMIRDLDSGSAEIFEKLIATQKEHLASLRDLREKLQASPGDVAAPS